MSEKRICGPYICPFPRARDHRASDAWTCATCGTAYRLTRPKPSRFWRNWATPHGYWRTIRRLSRPVPADPMVIDLADRIRKAVWPLPVYKVLTFEEATSSGWFGHTEIVWGYRRAFNKTWQVVHRQLATTPPAPATLPTGQEKPDARHDPPTRNGRRAHRLHSPPKPQ